jgi:hypothetical protein
MVTAADLAADMGWPAAAVMATLQAAAGMVTLVDTVAVDTAVDTAGMATMDVADMDTGAVMATVLASAA